MSSPVVNSPEMPPLPPPVAPYGVPAAKQAKSPLLALVLSFFFPGVGQLYNGQVQKAFAFASAFIGSIYLVNEVDPMPFALFLPFIFFYGMIDSYRSATFINERRAGLPATVEQDDAESPAWGGVLVVVGLLLLLNNLGWLRLIALNRYWPLVLVGLGGYFLYRSTQRRNRGGDGASV